MRWAILVVLVVHGLIHSMGFVKAFGFAELAQLKKPISRPWGVVWLSAALLFLGSAVLLAVDGRWFWLSGAVAIALSQAAIIRSWRDAKVGTAANVLALLAVAYGFESQGPWSARAEYAREAAAALDRGAAVTFIHEDDLVRLPPPVQAYLRLAGVVEQKQVHDFRAKWKGRIRGAPADPWMPFHAEQITVYEKPPTRLFLMDATMNHLPVDVFHRFVGDAATFQVRVLSAIPVVTASGPEMNRSETVTIFNDLCLLAPGRLIDPSIQWEAIDPHRVRAHYTRSSQTVAAELVFDDEGKLVDFVSDDRLQASNDGKTFAPMRWSTPVRDYRAYGARKVMTSGEGRWSPPSGPFTYLEIELEDIEYNLP